MTTATQSSAQRRLRVHLGLVGTTTGAVWGAVGLSLVDGVAVRTALSAAPTARTALLMAALLAAIPVGSLLGAPVLDLLSHAVGRRPAALASGVLVAVGAATAAAPRLWTGVAGGLVAGLGIGGYTIVVPKLAHELSERGHRRLVPRVRALTPAGAGTALVIGVSGGALLPGWGAACAWMAPLASALTACALVASLPETPHWYGPVEDSMPLMRRSNGCTGRSRPRSPSTGSCWRLACRASSTPWASMTCASGRCAGWSSPDSCSSWFRPCPWDWRRYVSRHGR